MGTNTTACSIAMCWCNQLTDKIAHLRVNEFEGTYSKLTPGATITYFIGSTLITLTRGFQPTEYKNNYSVPAIKWLFEQIACRLFYDCREVSLV